MRHPECYERLNQPERGGFLDIEATSLNASFGFLLSYCLKRQGGEVLKRVVTPEEIHGLEFDKRLCRQFLEDIEDFDRLYTFYGTRYDVPFLRTRCLYHNLGFPPMGTYFHTDVYWGCRNRLKLHSNRLEAACTFFGIPSKGTKLDPGVWRKAGVGCKKSLAAVLSHNEEDVVSLEALWDVLQEHVRTTKTSI